MQSKNNFNPFYFLFCVVLGLSLWITIEEEEHLRRTISYHSIPLDTLGLTIGFMSSILFLLLMIDRLEKFYWIILFLWLYAFNLKDFLSLTNRGLSKDSKENVYAEITYKHIRRLDQDNTDYLMNIKINENDKSTQIEISREIYDRINEGQIIVIKIKKGFLGYDYIQEMNL